jgi:hypothetical protein
VLLILATSILLALLSTSMASVDQIRKMIEAAQGPSGPMGDAISKKLKESHPPAPEFKLNNRDFLMGRAVKRWGVPEDHIQRVLDRMQYVESKDDPEAIQIARSGSKKLTPSVADAGPLPSYDTAFPKNIPFADADSDFSIDPDTPSLAFQRKRVGPGRGLFQFEFNTEWVPDPDLTKKEQKDKPWAGKWESQGAKSAYNRLVNNFDLPFEPGPEWKDFKAAAYDARELTAEQQQMLLLADLMIKPGDMGKSLEDDTMEGDKNFWRKHHWAGRDADWPAREAQWRDDLKARVITGQKNLVRKGFGPKSRDAQKSFIDGEMGPATRAAIKKFQAQNRIRQTEYFDKETRDLLGM